MSFTLILYSAVHFGILKVISEHFNLPESCVLMLLFFESISKNMKLVLLIECFF